MLGNIKKTHKNQTFKQLFEIEKQKQDSLKQELRESVSFAQSQALQIQAMQNQLNLLTQQVQSLTKK